MTIDFNACSVEFAAFYEAFSPATYGRSMGRAADQAMYDYEVLSAEEQHLATEWFLELFASPERFFGFQYFRVIETMNDRRFVPLLNAHYAWLKQRHNRPFTVEVQGEKITVNRSLKAEMDVCKHALRALQHRR